jgi:hypothetical protein
MALSVTSINSFKVYDRINSVPALLNFQVLATRVTRVTRMAYSPSLWLMAIGW